MRLEPRRLEEIVGWTKVRPGSTWAAFGKTLIFRQIGVQQWPLVSPMFGSYRLLGCFPRGIWKMINILPTKCAVAMQELELLVVLLVSESAPFALRLLLSPCMGSGLLLTKLVQWKIAIVFDLYPAHGWRISFSSSLMVAVFCVSSCGLESTT